MDFLNNKGENFSYTNTTTVIVKKDFLAEHTHAYITVIYLNSLTVIGIALNSFMFGVIICVKNYRRPRNYILAFLAILYVHCFAIIALRESTHSGKIPGEGNWMSNRLSCIFLLYLHRTCMTAISVTTVALSVERIHILRNPMMVRLNSKDYKRNILIILFYSFLMSCPIVFTRKYDEELAQCIKILLVGSKTISLIQCIWQFCIISLIPAGILFKETWITRFQIRYLLSREGMKVLTEDKLQQLFITSCVFTFIFVTCWLPFGFFLSFKDLPKEIISNESIWRNVVVTGFIVARNISYFSMSFNMIFLILMNYQWTRKHFFRSILLTT